MFIDIEIASTLKKPVSVFVTTLQNSNVTTLGDPS